MKKVRKLAAHAHVAAAVWVVRGGVGWTRGPRQDGGEEKIDHWEGGVGREKFEREGGPGCQARRVGAISSSSSSGSGNDSREGGGRERKRENEE